MSHCPKQESKHSLLSESRKVEAQLYTLTQGVQNFVFLV